jgi:hypothetical protein
VGHPLHAAEDRLDLPCLLLQHVEVRPENLDVERALESGLRLVHRIFRGLGVVERDSGKAVEQDVERVNQRRLVADGTLPLVVGLEPDIELGVEEAGRVGPVVRPAMLRGNHGHLREGLDDGAYLRNNL